MTSESPVEHDDRATPVALGESVPNDLVASPRDSTRLREDGAALRERLAEDGYLLLRGFFDRGDALAARTDVFARLAEVGEIDGAPERGIYSGRSERKERVADAGAFWKSVSETWSLRRLTHGRALHALMDDLLDTPSRAQDYLFLRPANAGKHTRVHCDYPFFTRETEQVLTTWIALGDAPIELGPLYLIEGSHRFEDLVRQHRGFDVARDTSRKAAFDESPQTVARVRGTRLLCTDFAAGDIVVFGMFLLHGALDNMATDNRLRLSCDVRYQPASAPLDPRYFGTSPGGTTGAGYGELIGAKPLTEPWHVR